MGETKNRFVTPLLPALPDFCQNVVPTNRAVDQWLIGDRWPDGPRCPDCGSSDVAAEMPQFDENETWFRCADCRRFFTVRTNHFTADPDISCRHWLLAIRLMVSESVFWSEAQIAHFLGLNEATTGLVIHAIHHQMQLPDPPPLESISKVFEVDEAYWPKHMDSADGERFAHRLYTVVVLERATGQVRIWVVADRDARTMVPILRRSGVGAGATLNCDGNVVYITAARNLSARRRWVNHDKYEWVRVDDPTVHINGAEAGFAWMRRALRNVELSQENLARYAAHAQFMINSRHIPVIDRIRELVAREHGPLTNERIQAEQTRFAPRTSSPRPIHPDLWSR